ncbi:carboxymuconolactone decarboxylase family protein [bacterium]|nr:carboxymuconolactone decarboxylase family protein [bacterium]
MDEAKRCLQEMARTRGYVLDYHKVLVAEDLPFIRSLNGVLAVSYTDQRRLDRKTKELLFIAAFTALGAAKDVIKAHIEGAKRHGATKEEILELLELLVLPCGVPKFMLGYEAWTESFTVRRVELDQP